MYQPRDFQQQIRRTMIMYLHCFFFYKWAERYLSQKSAPDLGGAQGARAQGPPPRRGPHHVHVFDHTYDLCVPLSHFY